MIEKYSILKRGIGIESEKYANKLEIKKYGNKLKIKLSDHRTKELVILVALSWLDKEVNIINFTVSFIVEVCSGSMDG